MNTLEDMYHTECSVCHTIKENCLFTPGVLIKSGKKKCRACQSLYEKSRRVGGTPVDFRYFDRPINEGK